MADPLLVLDDGIQDIGGLPLRAVMAESDDPRQTVVGQPVNWVREVSGGSLVPSCVRGMAGGALRMPEEKW